MGPIHPSVARPRSLDLRDLISHIHIPRLTRFSTDHTTGQSFAAARAVSRFALNKSNLLRRQNNNNNGIIPASYPNANSKPAPGAIVGIVLGSVAGFLLIVWLIVLMLNTRSASLTVADVETVRPRKTRRRQETIDISRSPRRQPRRVERQPRVVMEERPQPQPQPRPPPSHIIVDEPVSHPPPPPEDEFIEVIEEHSDYDYSPTPRRSRRQRESGFRPVDADLYAGGNYPVEPIYPPRRSRR